MTERNRWDMALDKLVEMTRSGRLRWTASCEFARRRIEEDTTVVDPAYLARYGEKQIAVYEYRYKNFRDADEWFWDVGVAIEFVDDELRLEWAWPTSGNRFFLLEAIRYQNSHAGEFLEQLLSEPSAS